MILKTIVCVLIVVVFAEVCCTSDVNVEEMGVDERHNITLPCGDEAIESYQVSWVRDGRDDNQTPRRCILKNGSLLISDVTRHDAGIYECQETVDEVIRKKIKVVVRTPPPPLANVTVHACTILASLRWDVEDTGGYPIDYFKAQYRLKHSPDDQPTDPWHPVVPEHISASASQIDVFHLEPNSTYIFQVWANNKLGQGEVFEMEATTHHNNEEIELGRHLLEGAETFDTRVWVAAVAVVMGTLVVLAVGTCYALYRECHIPLSLTVVVKCLVRSFKIGLENRKVPLNTVISDDQEIMELVPNIILNPGYHDESRTEWMEPDENSNDTTTTRLNNNSVIQPFQV